MVTPEEEYTLKWDLFCEWLNNERVVEWKLLIHWIHRNKPELQSKVRLALIEWLTDNNLSWFLSLSLENKRAAIKGTLPSRFEVNFNQKEFEELIALSDCNELNSEVLTYMDLSPVEQLKLIDEFFHWVVHNRS